MDYAISKALATTVSLFVPKHWLQGEHRPYCREYIKTRPAFSLVADEHQLPGQLRFALQDGIMRRAQDGNRKVSTCGQPRTPALRTDHSLGRLPKMWRRETSGRTSNLRNFQGSNLSSPAVRDRAPLVSCELIAIQPPGFATFVLPRSLLE